MIYCFYDGTSMFDKNIKVLSFLYAKSSKNTKIGNEIHYTITISEFNKIQNKSTCNNCNLLNNGCYVNGYMSNSYHQWRNKYNQDLIPFLDIFSEKGIKILKNISKGFKLRFNVTGDPLAIPFEYNKQLMNIYDKYIMYSHFSHLDSRYKGLTLSSVESYDRNNLTARIIPFTVKDYETDKEKVLSYIGKDEVICPNQTKGITCSQCMLCETRKKSIVFLVHGNKQNKLKQQIQNTEF